MVNFTGWFGEQGRSMGQRLLLIDDDDTFLYACARHLMNAGYSVEQASGWKAALVVIVDGLPLALLVTDVH
jgi:ActR/RegA family two-component response regulator